MNQLQSQAYHNGSEEDWTAESFIHDDLWKGVSTFPKVTACKGAKVKKIDWKRCRNPLGSLFDQSVMKPSETTRAQLSLAEVLQNERSPMLNLKQCARKVRSLGTVNPIGMVGISERKKLNRGTEFKGDIRHLGEDLQQRLGVHVQASRQVLWTHKKGFGPSGNRFRHRSDCVPQGNLKSSLLPWSDVNPLESEKLYRKMEDLSLRDGYNRENVLHDLNFRVTDGNGSQIKLFRTDEIKTKLEWDKFPLPLNKRSNNGLMFENQSHVTCLQKKINCSGEQDLLPSSHRIFFKTTLENVSERSLEYSLAGSPPLHHPQNYSLHVEQQARPHFLPAIPHKWSRLTVPIVLPENTPPPSPLKKNAFDIPENLAITIPSIKSKKPSSK